MTIEAKIVAHSSHPECPDLITVQTRYPRFIHSEVMTHRAFSRSASSSRAVPIERMIQDVLDDPARPVFWGSNKPGMQAGDDIDDTVTAVFRWDDAVMDAVENAKRLADLGLHKQIVNRVLEPFSHISVVITATDWQNFFDLRCHSAADPTMRMLAETIRDAIRRSTAFQLGIDDWHKPYGGTLRQSAARCARVSYLNHDGSNPDPDKDDALADRLDEEKHLSPFEHQAAPMPGERHANLNGWISYRSMMGE